ncbi:MAG TPA: hypothetical protein VGL82_08980 [Bryobacteraceae bacterium]
MAVFLVGSVAALGQQPPAPSSAIPHLVPGQTGSRVPMDFYVFSWQEFFALNWPALVPAGQLPRRGVPDTSKKPGDPGMRVWETWKTDYDLFPPQPSTGTVTPTAYSSWNEAVPICPSVGDAKVLPFISKGESAIPGGVNQAMGGPLVDQHGQYVRYEVRVNQTEYDETVAKSWFLRKNLSMYPSVPNLFSASTADKYGAIELKASWRVMTPQEKQANPPRYYMSEARVVDPKTGKCSDQPMTVGLVGFHIAHKTDVFQAWVWSTFEQVDNVPAAGVPAPPLGYSLYDGKTTNTTLKFWGFSPASAYKPVDTGSLKPAPATPVQVLRLDPIKSDVQKLNDQVRQMSGIKGTVWGNYELVDTQWQSDFPIPIKISNPNTAEDLYPQLKGFPEDAVANTTMETYFQGFKGGKPDPAKNMIGISTFGTSCLHCHYTSAQYDFSWMLADQAWPSAPGTTGTTKAVMKKAKK